MDPVGLDPFDALRGTRVPRLAHGHPRARQAVIQLRKRCPFDLSRVLGVRPFPMAKTLGASLTAECRRAAAGAPSAAIGTLVESLLHAPGIARIGDGGWGYEFDVQTRWAFYPTGSPNLIATVFVAHGLGTAGILHDDDALVAQMEDSARFLMRELLVTGERPFFRYTLDTERLVHNANLLGAGMVAMTGALVNDPTLVAAAVASARTTVEAQREDGSWPYGEGTSLGWTDNFHTAYNLDGLLQIWLASGDSTVRASLDRGVAHWSGDFFGPAGEPHYCPDRPYPYDIHSAATAIDLAARLATWGLDTGALAERVHAWTRDNLIDAASGATYYQKHRLWTDRRHFARWGDAHWALGTSSLALLRAGLRDPLETAVADASGVMTDAC